MAVEYSSARQSGPRSRFFWLLVCIGILAAGFIVMSLLRAFAPKPQQVQAPVSVPVVETVALEHRREPLSVSGNGLVTPRAEIVIGAQLSGEVVETHPQLRSGGRFAAGEVMLQIDPRSFRAALDEARAALQVQASSLELLERQLERSLSLREREFVDENSVDDLRSRRDQARANLLRQEAIVQTRELDLEHSRIVAPFDGFVLSEDVDIGDVVAPGRELARFYASDSMEVVVSLNVNDAAFIPDLWSEGGSARPAVVRAGYGGRRFEWPAQVNRVEADLDRNTRTVDVVVSIPEPQQPGRPVDEPEAAGVRISPPPLLVGMYADVAIEGMPLPGHFVLPVSAVHDGSIWIVEGESTLRMVDVEVVRQEGDQFVLLAPDLQEGTRIIVSNLVLVSDGMQVRVAGEGQ